MCIKKMAEDRNRDKNSFVKSLIRLAKQYEAAVVRDPSFATKIEVFLKISGYLIPG